MHAPTQSHQELSSDEELTLNQLFELFYNELYKVANRHRYEWNGHETLDTTALIHETYLKLSRKQPDKILNHRHFLALASKVMRQVLINYAEKESAQKRGAGCDKINIEDMEILGGYQTAEELLDLNAALKKLAKLNERQLSVFECRFFGGLTVEETAFALEISDATVKRDWQAACKWIYLQMGNSE